MKIKLGVTCIVLLLLVACASFTQNSYKALTVSQQTYDAALSALGDLYKQNKLTETQKDKAIQIGNLYKQAHNEAVTALLRYDASSDQTSQEAQKAAYMKAIAEASKQLSALLEYAKPFLTGGAK